MAHRFVALPKDGIRVHLKDEAGKNVREVIWGDYLRVAGPPVNGRLPIDWSPQDPAKRKTLYIDEELTAERRPLEIIFVDVGQGDGAVLITPERDQSERIIVIDAGQTADMLNFLERRFKAYRNGFQFAAAVLTHPDKDHYYGFKDLFGSDKIGFDSVYHNGIVEKPVKGQWEKIGGAPVKATDSVSYLRELAVDRAETDSATGESDAAEGFDFPSVMRRALDNPAIKDVRMLSTRHAQDELDHAWMPGFAPSDRRGYTIEVLGPVVEERPDGTPALRKLGDYGETKNGHSIILRLEYGRFRVLFGGDLNDKAEPFLLRHYSGFSRLPAEGSEEYPDMIVQARKRLQAEVMKTCHHGSEKVTDAFLDAVNPAAFVISSGDQEGHVHPRPDLLGRLGKFGRGGAPVILSTELQRSTRGEEDKNLIEKLLKAIDKLGEGQKVDLEKAREDVIKLGRSNVEVDGAIYLKTDGERLMTAFKIEQRSETKKWFSFVYEITEAGELMRLD
jgi:beta-lactamase superfamily II metal-dependent hydrolase